MKATAVILADHVTVREGLLHVLGGGITRVIRDPLPGPLGVMLALMLQPDDFEDLLKPHDIEVVIKHAGTDGEDSVAKAVMTLRTGAPASGPLPSVAVAVPLQAVPVSKAGTHHVTVSLDGEQAAVIEFEVVKASDPPSEEPDGEPPRA
jgi:hypothetical protein